MYREITAVEHDRFVSESNQTNLLQSSNWPKVKDNWGSQLLGFFDGETQIASASILIKSLPLGFSMLYIPRGPIMDYSNLDIVTKVLKDLKAFGKKQRALFIKCDPLIYLKMVNAKDFENSPDEKEGLIAIDHLQRAGADWTGRTTDLAHTIQPRFQANLYANQFGLDKMSKKTRQAIRTSKNKGVDIQFGSHELLEDFAELMKKTEDRKGINLRGIDYYQKLLDTYPNNSYITMASLDVAKRLEKIEKECQIAQSERIKSLELNREKKVKQHQDTIDRLNKEIDFLKEAQKAYDRDIVPLAATLTLEFGNTSENIYAGMDDYFKSYSAPIYTWFETAQRAFERGNIWQNMGGIENDLSGGLYHFKSKFEPIIEEFIGEFNIPVNRLLYKASNYVYALRKKRNS